MVKAEIKKSIRPTWSENEVKLLKRLFPLGRARETAKRASCINNMKQIYVGAAIYVDDYDGYLPKGGGYWADDLVTSMGVKNFTSPISKEDKGSGAFFCPSQVDSYGSNDTPIPAGFEIKTNYQPTLAFGTYAQAIHPSYRKYKGRTGGWRFSSSGNIAKKLEKITDGSVILIEKRYYNTAHAVINGRALDMAYCYNYNMPTATTWYWKTTYRHNRTANFLMKAGNVTTFNESVQFERYYWIPLN